MKNKPLISVVIPSFGVARDLVDTIKAVNAQDYPKIEVIVVSNLVSESMLFRIKKKFPKVKILESKYNLGVTGGRNLGFVRSRGDYLLFLDHDVIADSRMVSELISGIKNRKDIGIATGKIFYWKNKNYIWSAGNNIDLISGRVRFRSGPDRGQFNQAGEIGVAPSVILVKRKIVKKLSGFDDLFFANWEDADFCYRARKLGFKTFYFPKAIAYHRIDLDFKKSTKRLLDRTYWLSRNRIIFMKRHSLSFPVFVLFLPGYFLYYLYLSIKTANLSAAGLFLKGTAAGLACCCLETLKVK